MDGQKNLTVGSWIHQFSPRLTNSFVLTWSSTQGCEEGREAGNKKRFIGISNKRSIFGVSRLRYIEAKDLSDQGIMKKKRSSHSKIKRDFEQFLLWATRVQASSSVEITSSFVGVLSVPVIITGDSNEAVESSAIEDSYIRFSQ
ncbi:hypothetical protein M9H77_27291 [Catharanthus roseus]|uniref:Uncharacterized protein n=1 Tax=Catharanthus roseus TaxID=4058 RepID=A0ACC0AC27_CATRO|nr:hypothetical protein M9H77_27291 [Catharanthus roseus]